MSTHTIEYIQATTAHIPQIIALRINFLIDYGGEQPPAVLDEMRRHLQAYFETAIASGQYICWLAIADEELAGLGGMAIRQYPGNLKNPSGRNGYIMNIYTKPAYRRKGISSTIVQHLVDTGRAQGIRFFELHATKEGAPIYEKAGFEEHNEPTYRKYF